MMIQALTTLFAVIALYIGYFLVTHRNKPFLVFDPRNSKGFKTAVLIWGTEMLLVGCLTIAAAVVNSTGFIVVMLMIGCFSGTFLSFTFVWFLNHKR
ncbi:hypothetical protein ABTQ33_08980 [Paucilactobacillus suebicus]|uniref:hypothetical protein n=1 Tax=Paucilactobacillus suebicus TaxID=152335 RepID=UPI0002490BC8|nr:hypothetical protein [Paucilactobacillus suebicus]